MRFSELNARELGKELASRWLWILMSAALAAALVFLAAWNRPPSYSATALLSALTEGEGARSVGDFQMGNYLVQDYQRVLATWEVEEQVLQALEGELDHAALRRMIDISGAGNTRMLEITATASDARQAAKIANTYAEIGGRLAAEALHSEPPEFVSRAQPPQNQNGLSPAGMAAIGALCGAMGAAAVLVIRFSLDRRVRDGQSLRRELGWTPLAELPAIPHAALPSMTDGVPLTDADAPFPLGAGLTAYRPYGEATYTLCARLLMVHPGARKIVLTSARRGEGKTTVALHMLRTLARMGRKTVLVDMDFRNSSLTERGPAVKPGALHCLAGTASSSDALLATDLPGAWLMTAQCRSSAPPAALSAPKMSEFLDELARQFDVVLVDTPPVGEVADASLIAHCCDGALLVVGRQCSKAAELTRAREDVESAGCSVLGAVVNCVPEKRREWSISIRRGEG